MSDYSTPPAKRSRTSRSELLREPRDELVERCLKMQGQMDSLSAKQPSEDLAQLKEVNEKLRFQLTESSQREGILVMRLTAKEQEVQDLLTQLQETKQSLCPGSSQLQSMLLDPAVNLMFESFKKELDTSKTQLKQAQDDLAAFKFTPESHIGKRLMAKCRLLLNENEELGRTISSGSIAKLESTIALEKKFIQEMKKAEKDTEYFLYELSDDMEGMQATIYQLQQDLNECREQLRHAQDENKRLQSTLPPGATISSEASGASHGASEAINPPQLKRTETNNEDTNRLKRTASSTNAKPRSRHLDKKDANSERTNYKTGSRNQGPSSHGNQERISATARGSNRTGHSRQGDLSDSKTSSGTGANAVTSTRLDEPSNGSRHGNAEKPESVAVETHTSSTEKSRSGNERDNQKQRTGNSSNKMDAAGGEVANGLVSKHSVLTDTSQKV